MIHVLENVDSPLTVDVQFVTGGEMEGRVFYGESDPCEFYVATGELAGSHQLTLVGLAPGTTYYLFAEAEGEDGIMQSDITTYTTPEALPVPGGVPVNLDGLEIETQVYCPHPERVNPNTLVMTNLLFGNGFPTAQAVAWDRFGRPVYSYVAARDVGGGGTVDVSVYREDPSDSFPFLSNNEGLQLIVGGDVPPGPSHARNRPAEVRFDGELLHQGPHQGAMPGQENYMHHAYTKLAEDQYVTLQYRSMDWDRFVIHDGSYDPVVDEEAGLLWSMDTEGLLSMNGHVNDGNVATYDPDEGLMYYHARGYNILLAIDVATREVQWALGEGVDTMPWDPGTAALGQAALVDDLGLSDPWFIGAHAQKVYRHPDDDAGALRVLVHDNGAHSGNIAAERPFTRVIEYRIHPASQEVEIVWAFPQSQLAVDDALYPYLDYCNHHMGDVHRLSNGNVLVISGSTDANPSGDGLRPRNVIFEIAPDEVSGDADLVWWMETTSDQPNTMVAFYAGHPLEHVRGIIGDESLPTGLGGWSAFPTERLP